MASENGVFEVLTLTNICLNSVCKNIDIFNVAYHKTKNGNLKTHLTSLRRCHSGKVIRILLDQSGDICLHKKYFDFLINEFLKELDWFHFRGKDLDIILEMLPKIGETLEIVTFNFNSTVQDRYQPNDKKTYLNQVVKNALLHLPNVKAMRLMPSSNCDDKTLEMIYSSCKKLKELYLEGCPISNAGLKNLCPEDKKDNLFNLKCLILKSIHFRDEGVGYLLKNMPSLEYMAYDFLSNILHKLHVDDLRNNSLANVSKYNLTTLGIEYDPEYTPYTVFEETLMIATELCPRISWISVQGIKTEKQLQMVNKFSNLSWVAISGECPKLDVSGFLQNSGEKIKILNISYFKMNLPALVENCPNLESIYLSHIHYYISEKEQKTTILNNVKSLLLTYNYPQYKKSEMFVERLLDSCPNLERLKFIDYYCKSQQMSDVIQRYCEKSQTLKELIFTGCEVPESLLRHIVLTCTSLKKLVVERCLGPIRSYDIERLRDIIRANGSSIVVNFEEPFKRCFLSGEVLAGLKELDNI